jgi:hypothetical protein
MEDFLEILMSHLSRILLPVFLACSNIAVAGDVVPANPVRTCTDVQTYMASDNSMTMDQFKNLMTASGADLSKGGNEALDNQCKVTAYVKNVIMVQHILKKDDGGLVAIKTRVIMDNGVCKLTDIALEGC